MAKHCLTLYLSQQHRKLAVCLAVMLVTSTFTGRAAVLPYMPPTNEILSLTAPYEPTMLNGLKFFSNDPFQFTFLLKDHSQNETDLNRDLENIGRYFLAALTIPEKDLWVNLSPYEKNRVIPEALGLTDLGKDMLGTDYILKQLTASLTYPQSDSGREFWKNAKQQAQAFSKVWIVPKTIRLIETNDTVLIKEATLKVLCETDYLAQSKGNPTNSQTLQTESFKKHILPLLEKEVNTGKHFAYLRQIYSAIILAAWFKEKLTDSILAKAYFDKKLIKGADCDDPQIHEKIYNEYTKAFREGVYKYTEKSTTSMYAGKVIKRQYVSGGLGLTHISETIADGRKVVPDTEVLSAVLAQSLAAERITLVPLDAAGHDMTRQEDDSPVTLAQVRAAYEREKGSLSKIGSYAYSLVLLMENAVQRSVAEKFCKKGDSIERAERELMIFRARRAMANTATKRGDPKVKQLTLAHLERIWSVRALAPGNTISGHNILSGWYEKSTCSPETIKNQSLGLGLSGMFSAEEANELIRCGAVAMRTIEPGSFNTTAQVEIPIPLSQEIRLMRQSRNQYLRMVLVKDKYVEIVRAGSSNVYSVRNPENAAAAAIVFTPANGVDYKDQAFLYALAQIGPSLQSQVRHDAIMEKMIMMQARADEIKAVNNGITPSALEERLKKEFDFTPIDAALKEQLRRENHVNDREADKVVVYTPESYKAKGGKSEVVFTSKNSGPNFHELSFIVARKLWNTRPAASSPETATTEKAIRQGMTAKGVSDDEILLLGPNIREYARRVVAFDTENRNQTGNGKINTYGIHPAVINALPIKRVMEYSREAIDDATETNFINSKAGKTPRAELWQMCCRARRAMANIAMQTGKLLKLDLNDLNTIWQAHSIGNPADGPKGTVSDYDPATGHFNKSTYTMSTLGKKTQVLKANPRLNDNLIISEILKCAAAGDALKEDNYAELEYYSAPKQELYTAITDATDYIIDKLLDDPDSPQAYEQYRAVTNDKSSDLTQYHRILTVVRQTLQTTLMKAIRNDEGFVSKIAEMVSYDYKNKIVQQTKRKLETMGINTTSATSEMAIDHILGAVRTTGNLLQVPEAIKIAKYLRRFTTHTEEDIVTIINAARDTLERYFAHKALERDLNKYIDLNTSVKSIVREIEMDNRVQDPKYLPFAPTYLRDNIERYLREKKIRLREESMDNLSRLIYAARQRAGDRGAVEVINLRNSGIDPVLLKDIDLLELTRYGMGIPADTIHDEMLLDRVLKNKTYQTLMKEGYIKKIDLDGKPAFLVTLDPHAKDITAQTRIYSENGYGENYEDIAWEAAYDALCATGKGVTLTGIGPINQKNTGGLDLINTARAINVKKEQGGMTFSEKTASYLLNGRLAGFRLAKR